MVATLGDHDEGIPPGGVDDKHVTDVPADKPGDEEYTKSIIADGTVPEIFEHFCELEI